jgi:hypothetical protein
MLQSKLYSFVYPFHFAGDILESRLGFDNAEAQSSEEIYNIGIHITDEGDGGGDGR